MYDVCTPIWLSVSIAAEVSSMPAVISTRGPIFGLSLPAIGATTITTAVSGSVSAPAPWAE